MSLEIEKRFKNFNYNQIKKKFKDNNITKVGGYLFKISTYKSPKEGQSIRIRDEGTKITFTIKQKAINNYDTEYEVIVDNYEMIDTMIQLMGLEKNYDLYKYREIYKTKNNKSEIVLDHFPGLPPYMEIESSTEKELYKMMKTLELLEEPHFTAKDLYLEQYGITKDRKDGSLTFDNAKDVLSKFITKNKQNFDIILKKQIKKFL